MKSKIFAALLACAVLGGAAHAGDRLVTVSMSFENIGATTSAIVFDKSIFTTSSNDYASLVDVSVSATVDGGTPGHGLFAIGPVVDDDSAKSSVDWVTIGSADFASTYATEWKGCIEPTRAQCMLWEANLGGMSSLAPIAISGQIDTTDDNVGVDDYLAPLVTNVRTVDDTNYADTTEYQTCQPTSTQDGSSLTGTTASVGAGDWLFRWTERTDTGSSLDVTVLATFLLHEANYPNR